MRISRTTLSDWLHRGHTADANMSVFHAVISPWLHDTVCSDGSWSQTVLDRLSPIHRPSPSSANAPEVRVLPSTGVTRPQQYYDPVRIPLTPPPKATLRPLPSCQTGLPRLPEPPFQRAVPTTPADRMGAGVDCFPIHAAFPVIQAGRHPHHHFRGLLRLHSRYGPSDRSTAQGGLCHEASARPVTRPSRSSATGSIDNSPGEIFLHWRFAPSGRTG